MKRPLAFILMFALIFTLAAAGCSRSDNTGDSGNADNSSGTANSGSSTSAAETPRVKLTLFLGDAGIKFPSDVDPGDNPIINAIEDIANVDLVVTKPEYADFKTKFDLMMSSGEVLDIVHAWFPDSIKKYGKAGAFIALDDIIKSSKTLSAWQSEDILNLVRADDGKLYGLFANIDPSGDIGGHVVRYDLIEKYNNGKVPETPDEWYGFAKVVKNNVPDSTPFSSQGNLSFMTQFFSAYGVKADGSSVGTQLDMNNKVIFNFEAPHMKEAMEFYSKLYKDNLIDPNFITNKYEDFVLNRLTERNVISLDGGHWAIQTVLEELIKKNALEDQMLCYAKYPVAPGVDAVDVAKTHYKASVGAHSLSISSKCTDTDAAVRVLEAFCDPKTKYMAGYGIEGTEYKLENGKPVLDLNQSAKSDYRLAYGMMWQYWYDETIAVKNATILANADREYQSKFTEKWNTTVKYNADRASLAGLNPFEGITVSDDISAKTGDMNADAIQIMLKTIIGQYSMQEYDAKVQEFLKKYDFYKKAMQALYDAKNK